MTTRRLEAFSDGVIAILITIMVLELRAPQGATLAALRPVVPTLLFYLLSFVYLGIYWNNHHHLLQGARRITGGMMWANLHLLFWLSLVPFTTSWAGEYPQPVPTALYGVVFLASGFAYWILQSTIIASEGADSPLARAVGRDAKGKLSLALYASGVLLSLVHPRLGDAVYVLVALIWLVPDPRLARLLEETEDDVRRSRD